MIQLSRLRENFWAKSEFSCIFVGDLLNLVWIMGIRTLRSEKKKIDIFTNRNLSYNWQVVMQVWQEKSRSVSVFVFLT